MQDLIMQELINHRTQWFEEAWMYDQSTWRIACLTMLSRDALH